MKVDPKSDKKPTAMVWLRNDLRAHDQKSFALAAKSGLKVIAYYSFDPQQYKTTKWGFKKTDAYRAKFLIETLSELKKTLKDLNISLIVDSTEPATGIVNWVKTLNIKEIYFQKEWTQEERFVEDKLRSNLDSEINFHSSYDQFLFHPVDISFKLNDLPEVFTQFRKQCEKNSFVRQLSEEISPLNKENLLDQSFSIPTLNDLGLEIKKPNPNSAFPFSGGTSQAKLRIQHYFWETKKLSFYKQTRNGLVGVNYSSKFSAWLANGSISPRQLYWEIISYEKEIKKNQSTYWLIFELIWRDYFKYISLKHQNAIFYLGGILKKEYQWGNDLEIVKNWINGRTKESFVNANMIELQKTGWMSNRGRQNVASYFAKDLLLDWRIGAAYFESQLIDYDVHSNYGNWMYVAGVGNDPRDRKFDTSWQAQKYDSQNKFQKLWLK